MMGMMSKPTFYYESLYWKKDYLCVGLDEVGRGAFAGPVVVGAVVFGKNATPIDGIHDSKLLSVKMRERLDREIRKTSLAYAISLVDVPVINRVGIGKATNQAFRLVIRQIAEALADTSLYVLIDGFHVKYLHGYGLKRQQAIIKGDRKSLSIAAASIIAKVYRDRVMTRLSTRYPAYRFDINKGYGTAMHRAAIASYGLSRLHRASFSIAKYKNCP